MKKTLFLTLGLFAGCLSAWAQGTVFGYLQFYPNQPGVFAIEFSGGNFSIYPTYYPRFDFTLYFTNNVNSTNGYWQASLPPGPCMATLPGQNRVQFNMPTNAVLTNILDVATPGTIPAFLYSPFELGISAGDVLPNPFTNFFTANIFPLTNALALAGFSGGAGGNVSGNLTITGTMSSDGGLIHSDGMGDLTMHSLTATSVQDSGLISAFVVTDQSGNFEGGTFGTGLSYNPATATLSLSGGSGSPASFSPQFSANNGNGTNYILTNQSFYGLSPHKTFSASGKLTQTTGTISGSSHSLTVGSAATWFTNEGICIAGAGANPGTNLVTVVTAINGTAFSLRDAAGTGVTSATVWHDDTFAISNALTQAATNGTGRVYLDGPNTNDCDGVYYCAGPFVPGANAVLTFPLNTTTAGVPVTVILEGEESGGLPDNVSGIYWPTRLDFTHAQNINGGTDPSGIGSGLTNILAGNTYQGFQNQINLQINHLTILTPANTGIGAINFRNGQELSVGNDVNCFNVTPATGAVPACTVPSTGIIFPQHNNRMQNFIGGVNIVGYWTGMQISEGAKLNGPWMAFCNVGVELLNAWHLIQGNLICQTCQTQMMTMITAPLPTFCPIDLTMSCEAHSSSGSFTYQAGFVDANGITKGKLDYEFTDGGTSVYNLTNTVAPFVDVRNLADLPARQITNCATAASSITFNVPISYTSATLKIIGNCTAASPSVSIKLNFNGDTGTNYNLLYAYNGQGNIGGGTPIVTGELTQQTSMDIGNMIATQSGGGLYPNSGTVIVASIPGYASGFYKTVQCNGDELSDPNEQDFFDGTWFSTAKISTVTIAPSAGSFAAGTIATLNCE